MHLQIFCVASLVMLTACATSPGQIKPIDYPADPYLKLECPAILTEKAKTQKALSTLESSQRSAATADVIGNITIGIPVGSLGKGDRETQIAVAKGQLVAMDRALSAKGCKAS